MNVYSVIRENRISSLTIKLITQFRFDYDYRRWTVSQGMSIFFNYYVSFGYTIYYICLFVKFAQLRPTACKNVHGNDKYPQV